MFPSKKEKFIHSKIPGILLPLGWISSVVYLADMNSDNAYGLPLMLATFFGIPLLVVWLMRIGEFNAIESMVKGLEYAEKKGDYRYGDKEFNRTAKEFILGWWDSKSRS